MTAKSPGPGHRWFAALYDLQNRGMERRLVGPLRRRLLSGLAGDVLEVGPGTGANFEHYPTGVRVIAYEPDPYMLRRAQAKLVSLGRTDIDVRQASAERLPVPDASFEAVVCTLVLCSVNELAPALAEMRRVLQPGGRLIFIEHVRGEGMLGRFQDLIRPLWNYFGAGCHPNRRTEDAIRNAGFDVTVVERPRFVIFPGIAGVASRGT